MRTRDVGRFVCMFVLVAVTGIVAVSCGGNGGGNLTGLFDASVDDGSVGQFVGKKDGAAGGASMCTPMGCSATGYTCGTNADGCGGTVSCGTCTAPDYCGGGGFSKCGNPSLAADGGAPCTPTTCSALGYTCGSNADGCGGTLDCGTCTGANYCGGGGFSQCGTGPATTADGGPKCVALTCAGLGNTCGVQGDGCGGLVGPCGTGACAPPTYCGGGGFNTCGGYSLNTDGGPFLNTDGGPFLAPDGGMLGVTPPPCVPLTCAGLGNTCGTQGDGCGGTIGPCGTSTTCTPPQFCGGGGFNQCGGTLPGFSSDGGVQCIPITCSSLGNTCGSQSDGCGGLVGPCGTTTCTTPEFCGGGGFNKCGGDDHLGTDGGVMCSPKTCGNYGYHCGQASDGCGSLTASCGTCPAPEYCGGGGAYTCGGNVAPDGGTISACVPKTCASAGYNCGMAGDGCGGTIGPCGPSCSGINSCGGGGKPNVCGTTVSCTGLCADVPTCTTGTTTITGIVRAGIQEGTTNWNGGATPDPIPGVLVYIPQGTVSGFGNPSAPQVQCQQCGADVSGNPLVSTTTNYDGTFTLTNTPVGTTVPIVIQLGRWRRQFSFTVPAADACGNFSAGTLNMPSKSTEGDIPLTAISTGNYDPMECVFLKMGVAQTEFTDYTTWAAGTSPDGGAPRPGRLHIYTAAGGSGNANPGAYMPGPFHKLDENVLMGNSGTAGPTDGHYMDYDQILFPCWGGAQAKTAEELTNLATYGNGGGHFFATHYSYTWLHGNNNGNLNSVAQWELGADDNITCPVTVGGTTYACATPGDAINGILFSGNVSNTVPPTIPVTNPGMFVKWLNYVGALSNSTGPTNPPPATGTVSITAARHDVQNVANGSVNWINGTDPNPGGGDSSQMELHFSFDMPISADGGAVANQCGHGIYSDFHVVSSATSNGVAFPGECDTTAMNAQERIIEYMIWDLASCVPSTTSTCVAKTCAQQGINCGPAGDGCGNLIPGGCGVCTGANVCGGGGVANVCGVPDGGACTKSTCVSQGLNCGPAGDGCGGTIASCGTCTAPQTCGGSGTPGVCGAPDAGCVSLTCGAQGFNCGPAGDGCGNLIPGGCGTCPAGQTCGGGGTAGVCGAPSADGGGSCMALSCVQQNLSCGPAGDGCGNTIASCGTCTPPQTCGGGGVPGQCGGVSPDAGNNGGGCNPSTCQMQGISCGPTGDGCGMVITSCGTCTPPQTCGGGGTSGVCGGTSSCVPQSCAQQNISCGPAGDGCGNLIQCGPCTLPQTCGGGGTPGVCGGGTACVPMTCADEKINCGPAGDGCGGTIASCGTCTPPASCGGGGVPGQCGTSSAPQ